MLQLRGYGDQDVQSLEGVWPANEEEDALAVEAKLVTRRQLVQGTEDVQVYAAGDDAHLS